LILKLETPSTEQFEGRRMEAGIFRIRAVPSLALVLMGLMDWLTTTLGISYCGAVESNPFIAGVAGSNLPAFTVIKLSATLFAALLFYQGERLLSGTQDKTKLSFKYARTMLRGACIGATVFLLAAVVNNLVIVVNAL
jgi:hypothetical protein